MTEKLIKSKQRVKDFAEVFTPQFIVKDMCDLVPQEMWTSVETTFLEPACGTGNFLAEILSRKFRLCKDWQEGLKALNSVYGIDIQQDNVEETKLRLFDMYIAAFPKAPALSGIIAVCMLEKHIVQGDFIPEFTKKINEKRRKASESKRPQHPPRA